MNIFIIVLSTLFSMLSGVYFYSAYNKYKKILKVYGPSNSISMDILFGTALLIGSLLAKFYLIF